MYIFAKTLEGEGIVENRKPCFTFVHFFSSTSARAKGSIIWSGAEDVMTRQDESINGKVGVLVHFSQFRTIGLVGTPSNIN